MRLFTIRYELKSKFGKPRVVPNKQPSAPFKVSATFLLGPVVGVNCVTKYKLFNITLYKHKKYYKGYTAKSLERELTMGFLDSNTFIKREIMDIHTITAKVKKNRCGKPHSS